MKPNIMSMGASYRWTTMLAIMHGGVEITHYGPGAVYTRINFHDIVPKRLAQSIVGVAPTAVRNQEALFFHLTDIWTI